MIEKPYTRVPMEDGPRSALDAEILEVPFLLPRWQIAALETVAHERGITTAAMLRVVLQELLDQLAQSSPAPPAVEGHRRFQSIASSRMHQS